MSGSVLHTNLRSQQIVSNAEGYDVWDVTTAPRDLDGTETALVLCDVWDKHWCRGADERLGPMLGRMNEVAKSARNKGVLVVHASSDTMDHYADHPARLRALEAPEAAPPEDLEHNAPPLPVETHDATSCDTPPDMPRRAWSSQNAAIDIDPDLDVISDNGRELYRVYQARGIRNILIMGVHTNMCMLGRSFAIKQMVRWGFNTVLIRDLTDTMYSPRQWPYVSHEEGTRLVVEYIEKFWCPSVMSSDLLA